MIASAPDRMRARFGSAHCSAFQALDDERRAILLFSKAPTTISCRLSIRVGTLGKRSKKSGLAFVQLFKYVLKSPAWRDLSLGARATYAELKTLYNGSNNGSLGFGSRGAANVLGVSKSTAARFLQELESHGFIVRQKESTFYQTKKTIEWCLTEARNDVTGEPPTRLFLKWTPIEKIELVPPAKASVPSTGQKASDEIEIALISPMDGTKGVSNVTPQSLSRDASTSKPYAGAFLGWTVSALAQRVRQISKLQIGSADAGSATSKAVAIAEDIFREIERNPLLQSIENTFPGSRYILSAQEIEDRARRLKAA